jgi:hypothetical protein
MLIEHLIYSTALAIFLGMIHYRLFKRDYSWIIIVSAYAPDLDIIFNLLHGNGGIAVVVYGHSLEHGDFHNIAILILYATFVALLLHPMGFKLADSFIFAGIGFAVHLFEDALVFRNGYRFLWPLVPQQLSIGLLPEARNFYGIANREVMIIGLILLFFSVILRTACEGPRWVTNYLPMNWRSRL